MQITDRTRIDARIAGAFRATSQAKGSAFATAASNAARGADTATVSPVKTGSAEPRLRIDDQTWFELVKKEGPSLGLERLADRITTDAGGFSVADPTDKAKILSLKTDPLVSSIVAGRLDETNARTLTETLGRKPSAGELEAARQLGASGAAKLVRMAESEPTAAASLAFPKAAAADPARFYDRAGKPVSAADLVAGFTATRSDATARIAEAHAALPADRVTKLDPKMLADLVRVQAVAAVAGEGIAGATTGTPAGDRFTRTALTEKGLPGAARDVVPAAGPRLDGWRAKASNDAFTAMARSDAEAPAVVAATARRSVGGASGGIPFVDPNQPLRLVAEPAAASSPAAVAATTLQPPGIRPSRLMSAAASGAPAMPLPMVGAGGVVQPSRILTGSPTETAAPAASGLVAPGAARVKTVSIAPASTTTDRLLPPVPGETADPAAPPIPTVAAPAATPTRASSASRKPLDLLGFRRPAPRG
jgi:hypothetical protein